MNMVQVYIKGQEDKELSSFFRYYPVRIKILVWMHSLTAKSSLTLRMVATILRWQSA